MYTKTLTQNQNLPHIGGVASLLVKQEGHKEQVVEVGEFLTIGRDTVNQVVFDDPFLSSRHARLEKRETGYFIKDLQSHNGIYVNGVKVGEAALEHFDKIHIGKIEFTFLMQKNKVISDSFMESKNENWNKVLLSIPKIANSDFAVLIYGPSGSGKEIIAQNLHKNSKQGNFPMINVNCSALNESLIESELFGHLKGSFTGAQQDRKGAFVMASGSTLFLDEIGDLPLSLQPKLLRALENQEIKPVGADKPIKTNVRIIAATHKNLAQEVAKGNFREDLFYRLNVLKVTVPSLTEREEDFESLLYFFAKKFKVRFSFMAIQALKKQKWPGQIRELKNTVARAAALFGKSEVTEGHLPDIISSEDLSLDKDNFFSKTYDSLEPTTLKVLEKKAIYERLSANFGNQRKTADELGIPKSTLHDRVKTYEIDVKKFKKNR
ncbi:MAG: sigma 54-interacting transcriptional regulator [Bdellovibrionaceae bacterium]|nr:sigma 54-interacting transcriptional regulator [Pseudobdellovibrionaceae bacterium]